MTVVIDTNIFIISLTSQSPYHKIYTSLVEQKDALAVSNDILLEYNEILSMKYSPRVAHEFLNLLAELPNVKQDTVYFNWNLIAADRDENKYADCAIAAAADFFVTEDKRFNILQKTDFPKMNVIGLKKFMKMI
ncbi:MAG: putative toxin-antitoxin system toxin component, PIN family [Chitinophagales bacterium]|nr:putative toxin-antitoxin system toxin component, PIN family [Chitinophagales bacterium]